MKSDYFFELHIDTVSMQSKTHRLSRYVKRWVVVFRVYVKHPGCITCEQ